MDGEFQVPPVIRLAARFRAVRNALAVVAVLGIKHQIRVHADGHDRHGDGLVDKIGMARLARDGISDKFYELAKSRFEIRSILNHILGNS